MSTPGIEQDADFVEEIMVSFFGLDAAELPAAVERACAEHPEHADEIRKRLRAVRFVFEEGSGGRPAEASFPDTLGDFRLIERLGGGGMGVVYRAEQRSLGREVALKVIRPELLYFQGARERFRRETEAVARLQHPGIVGIHTVGEEKGLPFFAMELLTGRTLSAVLHSLAGRAPEMLEGRDLGQSGSWVAACVEVLRQLAEAVEHAHQRGILHRDVKPSNAMLLDDGRVVLLDFGLTSFAGHASDERMTRTGSQVGTLAYMSPEQLKGGAEPGARTDVYSLGVTLYELLTLQVPYREESPVELQQRVLEGAPDSIRARNRRVPRDAEIVCLHAMEARPQDRYPTAAMLAHDLANVLERRPIEARPPGPVTRAVRWAQRRPARALAYALTVLLVAGLPTGLYVQQRLYTSRLQTSLTNETQAKELAAQEAEVARQVTEFLDELFAYAGPNRSMGEDLPVSFILELGAQRIEHELQDQPAVRARLLQTFGLAYDWLGSNVKAEPFLRESFELTLRLEGPDSPGSLQARLNLARVLGELGRYDKAERMLSDALDGPQDDDLTRSSRASVLSDHGQALSHLGRMEEAEAELLRAVEIQRSIGGGRHHGTAYCLNSLAGFYADARRPEEARPNYAEAYELYSEIFVEGPRLLQVKLNLARNLLELGEVEQASRLAEETLADARRFFGQHEIKLVPYLHMSATIAEAQGKRAEAMALLTAAQAVEERSDLPSTGSLAWILNDIGQLLVDRGDYAEAEELLSRAVGLEQSLHAEGHSRTAILLANLAAAKVALNDLAGAAVRIDEALVMERRLGLESAGTLSTQAWILILQGRLDEGAEVARQGLSRVDANTFRPAQAGPLRLRLAFIHNQRGEGELAEDEVRAALELETVDRLYRAQSFYQLGWARELQGDPDGAAENWVRSIEMFRRLAPRGHPDAMWVLNHHGGALLRAGRADEGLPYLEEALAIVRRIDRGPYWSTIVLANAGTAMLEVGDHEGAEELLLEAHAVCADAPELSALQRATESQLVRLYEAWGKPDAAAPYR